jgi:ATP-dependent exoDNAse (exonuclease V) beta subunit
MSETTTPGPTTSRFDLKERGRPAHIRSQKTVGGTPTLLDVNGQFPNGRILEADDNDMLEEERRLFYVALTRAKDELYLTYPMTCPGIAQWATTGESQVLYRRCHLPTLAVS